MINISRQVMLDNIKKRICEPEMKKLSEIRQLYENTVRISWGEIHSRENYICMAPFTTIEVFCNGDIYACKSDRIKPDYSIGNIYNDTFDDIWNSERAKIIRYAATVKNFEYCTSKCKLLRSIDEGKVNQKLSKLNYENYEECIAVKYPEYIYIYLDENNVLSEEIICKLENVFFQSEKIIIDSKRYNNCVKVKKYLKSRFPEKNIYFQSELKAGEEI